MKALFILSIGLLSACLCFSQERPPDTLEVQIKTGEKILLIGKDVQVFRKVKVDSIIRKALSKGSDSVPAAKDGYTISKRDNFPGVLFKKRSFVFQPGIGLGLIKDKLSPFWGLALDFAPQRQDYFRGNFGMYTFLNVAAYAYYTFENAGAVNNRNYTNVFLEGSIGNRFNNKAQREFKFDEFAFGGGYLINEQGEYFQGNTFKAFFSVVPAHSFVRLRPELYFTDNFRKAWPGINISAKIFGETPLLAKKKKQRKSNPQSAIPTNSP